MVFLGILSVDNGGKNMKSLYTEYMKTKMNNKILKILSAVAVGLSVAVTIANIFLSLKNKAYKDALIDLSEQFPEDDGTNEKEERWRKAHSNQNRSTVEERLDNNRVTVEA